VSSPDDGLIRAETCREYRSYLIKYFINCCETEDIIIYNSLNLFVTIGDEMFGLTGGHWPKIKQRRLDRIQTLYEGKRKKLSVLH
jgi:hypothetical protein